MAGPRLYSILQQDLRGQHGLFSRLTSAKQNLVKRFKGKASGTLGHWAQREGDLYQLHLGESNVL